VNGTITIVHRERLAVKIGMGGINQQMILPEAIERAVLAMQSFKNTINKFKVQEVFAFGTSALRNAKNTQAVLHEIKSITDIDVEVISGDREADFIYRGAASALDLGTENSLILDIGGGSVEFIIGNNKGICWKASVDIGAQRLLEKFQQHDPIHTDEIEALEVHFDKKLGALFNALTKYKPQILVGSSGTFDTLSDIFCAQHHILKSPEEIETALSLEGFHEIYSNLLIRNRKERMEIPGMIEMRVDMIVVACCLINYILKNHHFNRIRVSTYALKEGVLSWLRNPISA
jgi:exopolyphosphatase/guanosine-5'-triphosphate,3'-diphosphate pyrophosphatase